MAVRIQPNAVISMPRAQHRVIITPFIEIVHHCLLEATTTRNAVKSAASADSRSDEKASMPAMVAAAAPLDPSDADPRCTGDNWKALSG